MIMRFYSKPKKNGTEIINGGLTVSSEIDGTIRIIAEEGSKFVDKAVVVDFTKEDFKLIAKTLMMIAEMED